MGLGQFWQLNVRCYLFFDSLILGFVSYLTVKDWIKLDSKCKFLHHFWQCNASFCIIFDSVILRLYQFRRCNVSFCIIFDNVISGLYQFWQCNVGVLYHILVINDVSIAGVVLETNGDPYDNNWDIYYHYLLQVS